MVREGRKGRKGKSKDVEEAAPEPQLLAVPEEPRINKYLKRDRSPFEVGDKKELQVASSAAIIDKACVMDISGGAAAVAGKVDEYINLLFTDYCSLDKASCADISEVKIVIVEEEPTEPVEIVPQISAEEEEENRRKEEEARKKREAEERRKREEREEAERKAREEAERLAAEEAERLAKEEEERRIREEEEKKKKEEEEKARKKAEAEAKKKAEEEEKARIAAEEAAKKQAEEDAAQKAAEQAAYDSDKDLIPIKEDLTIEWEAAEEDTTDPAVQVLQEILEQRAIEESESESEPEMTERDRDLAWQRERQMMRPPLVISHLKSRAVASGTTAKLTCNVTGPGITVRWLKNGRPIDLKPEKYKFFNSDGLLSLEILHVKKRDEAEYSCIVTNKNGETSTLCALQVYDSTGSDRPSPPTFITIKESYNLHHDLLTLECRVRGTPKPHIQWMKDGDYLVAGDKYETKELPDGTCKLIIHYPEAEADSGTYTCEAECNGCSDSISHNVQFEGSVDNQFKRVHRYYHRDPLKPYFKTGLTDYTIPSGGTIALFVEAGANCEVEWFRDRYPIDHKPPKRYLFQDGMGFFACIVNAATLDESAKYICKVTNSYGTSQSSSYIDIINPNTCGKGQKPPSFLTRPQPEIKIRAGDPFSMSFRVGGEPKPRIQWFKGAREISNSQRTIKEVFNDYVRFSVKEAKESDTGIYFIVARNKHGVDRAFCKITVKQGRSVPKKEDKQVENVVTEAAAVVESADRSEKDRS